MTAKYFYIKILGKSYLNISQIIEIRWFLRQALVLNENGFIEYIHIAIYEATGAVTFQQKLMEMNRKDAPTKVRKGCNLNIRLKEEIERNKRYQ